MFRITIYLVLFLFLFGFNVFAIDKTSSKKEKVKTADNPVTLEGKEIKTPSDSASNVPSQPTGNNDYNNFIDANNNGIDDRAENKRKNVQTPAETKDSPTGVKAVKADSTAKNK